MGSESRHIDAMKRRLQAAERELGLGNHDIAVENAFKAAVHAIDAILGRDDIHPRDHYDRFENYVKHLLPSEVCIEYQELMRRYYRRVVYDLADDGEKAKHAIELARKIIGHLHGGRHEGATA